MMQLQMKQEMFNKGKQKEKIKVDVGINDFYNHYAASTFKEKIGKRSVVHKESKFCIDKSTYGKVIDFMHDRIIESIIFDNFEYKLPARMGTLSIYKRKPKLRIDEEGKVVNTFPIDWKATRELWAEDPESREQKKLIKHLNEHTNGYVPFWNYNTRPATFKYKSVYKFNVTRTAKRNLSAVLKDPNIKTNYYLK